MTDAKPRAGSKGRLFGKVAFALAIFVLSLEALVRWLEPVPRVQIVRESDEQVLYEREGQALWRPSDPEPRYNQRCRAMHPAARSVLIFGSSIFFGTALEAHDVWSHHIQRLLDEQLGPGAVCVQNYAQPGYAAENNLAVAEEVIPPLSRPVILWQIWDSDGAEYRRLGQSFYGVDRIMCGEDGYPVGFGLKGGAHRWLFRNSRAYEYAVLSLVPEAPDARDEFRYRDRAVPKLQALFELTRRHEATLKLFMVPGLDQPFRDQIGERARYGAKWGREKAAAEWADAHGVPRAEVAELLADEDYLAIRMDSCCHYNAAGHVALARVMLPEVLALLGRAGGG